MDIIFFSKFPKDSTQIIMIIVRIREIIPNFSRFLFKSCIICDLEVYSILRSKYYSINWYFVHNSTAMDDWAAAFKKVLSNSSYTKLGWSNEYGLKAFTHYFVSPKAISDIFALNLCIWIKEVVFLL